MTTQPIIGVLLIETQATLTGPPNDILYCNTSYFTSVELAGGIPVGIPVPSLKWGRTLQNLNDMPEYRPLLELCDGFVIPGGADVDPAHYDADPHAKLGGTDWWMDAFGAQVLEYANATNKPVLGICRGLQLINVAMGGTLIQDIPSYQDDHILHVQHAPRNLATHTVNIEPTSHLAVILGETSVRVNSFHHQAALSIAPGLRISATAPDGIVEGLESPDGRIICVQWHPEEMQYSQQRMRRLFSDLITKGQASNPPTT